MNLSDIPIREGVELIEDLIEEGMGEDAAIQQTAEFLDLLIDLEKLAQPDKPMTGQAMAAAELIDGILLEAALRLAWKWVQKRPERVERRQKRRAARQERRADKKAVR